MQANGKTTRGNGQGGRPENTQAANTTAAQEPAGDAVGPRWVSIAQQGVRTSMDVGNLMSAVLSDLANEFVTPGQVKAITKPCEVMIRNAVAQHTFGSPTDNDGRELTLANDPDAGIRAMERRRIDRVQSLRRELADLGSY